MARFIPFILKTDDEQKIGVRITRMKKADAAQTEKEPVWQTSWMSAYIQKDAFEKYDEKIYSKILDIREANQSIDERPVSAFKIVCNIAPEINLFWNGKLYHNNDEIAEDLYEAVAENNHIFEPLFSSKAIRVFYEVNEKRKANIEAIDDILKISEESMSRAQLYYACLLYTSDAADEL